MSPLFYTLVTDTRNHTVRFTDDTAVVGLTSKNTESVYRQEVKEPVDWCREYNLGINVMRTIVDNFKYLGLHIFNDLKWATSAASIVKKAQRMPVPFEGAEAAWLSPAVLTSFRHSVPESILTSSVIAWYTNCSTADRKALQWVVKSAPKMTNSSVSSLEHIYVSRCRSTHPTHKLFTPPLRQEAAQPQS